MDNLWQWKSQLLYKEAITNMYNNNPVTTQVLMSRTSTMKDNPPAISTPKVENLP